MTQPRTTGLALCPRCNQPSRLSTIGGECLSCTMEAKPPRTLEEIADEAMINSVRATDNMQWCNSVKTVILAALREAVEAAVRQEREALRAEIIRLWDGAVYDDALELAETARRYSPLVAWIDARSRSEEPKPE